MKKLLSLLAIILPLFVFSSCSDDDDEVTTMTVQELNSELNGEWRELGYVSGDIFEENIKFVADGSFSYRYIGKTRVYIKGEWKLTTPNKILLTEDGKTTEYNFYYEMSSTKKGHVSNIYISPFFKNQLYKQ